jgi:vancomycin resistance protein YoaR
MGMVRSQEAMNAYRTQSRSGSFLIGAGGLVVLVAVTLIAAYFLHVQDATASGTAVGTVAVAAPTGERPAAPATGAAARPDASVDITFDKKTVKRTWADLGVGAGGAFDRSKAEAGLVALKHELDRAPTNARMDLERRKIHKDEAGWGIDVYASLSAIEAAARSGQAALELEGAPIPPTFTVKDLGIEDISVVLGRYSTTFPIADKARNDNLKLLASHMDGVVIQPGQEISFNGISGDRTEKEGYKVAHVITAGEMVDGMAGGSCQISTTLHGAAFFAGLDITDTTPHSRPSTYVPLGLDSTVVYPVKGAKGTDLKVKNPYSFPVAVRYRVARGEAEVEILGKEKPFDKIEFVREVVEQKKFETVTREDDKIGVGHMVIDQPGFPGYKMFRYRNIYKGGKIIDKDKWTLNYPPVVEYVRMGINPDPNLPAPKQKNSHMPKPAKGSVMKIVQ